MRIQKFLSEAGACSRRQAEKYLEQGLIKINNKIIKEQGTKIDPDKDQIKLNNKEIKLKQYTYLILNKPKGYVSSFDHKNKKTLKSLIKTKEHLGYAGRLDEDSEGLMFLTNDGNLIYKLTHPKFQHEKEYIVETKEKVPDNIINKLKKGVKLKEGQTNPIKIKKITNNKFNIILNEGKNRQIRRMFKLFNINVTKLKRIRINNLKLNNLKPKQTRRLTEEEIKLIKNG